MTANRCRKRSSAARALTIERRMQRALKYATPITIDTNRDERS